jgi:hypothetical protein
MKTNKSAPLTPLAPPAGITGTTLPPASPVKDTPACPQTYFESDVAAMVGDRISAGSMGDCKVLELTTDGYLRVQNLFTKETAHVFASDCDLVDRPAPASPVESVGVPVTYRFVGTKELDSEILHITAEGSLVIGRITLREPFRSEMLGKLNSHAAKDAKIQKLEKCLSELVDIVECGRGISPEDCRDLLRDKESTTVVDTARDALALPCAPLGS